MRKYILTITDETLREVNERGKGKPKTMSVRERDGIRATMGDLQPYDIGKQVFLVGEVYQVENDEQLKARLSKSTWYWLTETEQKVLLDFNPDAESVINGRFGIEMLTETQYFPYRPVGRNQHDQGGEYPWLPPKRIIVNENTSSSMEIHHPQDSSFSKWESRRCVSAIVRKRYMLDFGKLVKAVMQEGLEALPWSIYEPSGNGTQHIYLDCSGPGVSGDKIALYVPTEYFRSHDFSIVEKFHNDVAVGYYKGSGFRVDAKQLKAWQEITASALTKPETLKMRAIVERA